MPTASGRTSHLGLTSAQAARLLSEHGRNEFNEPRVGWPTHIAARFWAPVPWMLEAAIALQLISGEHVEAFIVGAPLMFNAALGLFQEQRASGVVDALRQRLMPIASVKRDGAWIALPTPLVVPSDLVELSLGGVVPADSRTVSGAVELDQSMLTGESAPVDARAGAQAYAGALIRRGNALAEVSAAGAKNYFGRTAEIVRMASSESSEQRAIVVSVRNLAVFNGFVVAALLVYAGLAGMPLNHVMALILTAVLASIPVALPATFTLSAALGAQRLARQGVLLTRLSALHEAGAVDVLCVDKTGTLTQNTVRVATVRAFATGMSEADILAYAAQASADGSPEPVDSAVHQASASHPSTVLKRSAVRMFTLFRPPIANWQRPRSKPHRGNESAF